MSLTGRLCVFIILVSFYVRFFYFEGAWKYNFVLNPYMFHHVLAKFLHPVEHILLSRLGSFGRGIVVGKLAYALMSA